MMTLSKRVRPTNDSGYTLVYVSFITHDADADKLKVKLEIYIADLKAINRIGHAYSAPLC